MKPELKTAHGSDEFLSTDSDWDSQFPALSMKTHNTFTLTSGKFCGKEEVQEASQKSAGDTCFKVQIFTLNESFSFTLSSHIIMSMYSRFRIISIYLGHCSLYF